MSDTDSSKTKKSGQKKPGMNTKVVPDFAYDIAARLGTALDERAKFVLAAAVLAFAELPTATQVQLVSAARVQYAESVKAGAQ